MSEYLDESDNPQVLYDGRWVPKQHFRAFVYNSSGSKLANTYQEFAELISSGIWFMSKEDIKPRSPINIKTARKAKNGSANS